MKVTAFCCAACMIEHQELPSTHRDWYKLSSCHRNVVCKHNVIWHDWINSKFDGMGELKPSNWCVPSLFRETIFSPGKRCFPGRGRIKYCQLGDFVCNVAPLAISIDSACADVYRESGGHMQYCFSGLTRFSKVQWPELPQSEKAWGSIMGGA